MAKKHTEEFKQEAIRIALTSGLTRKQVADDLGVGFSTLANGYKNLVLMICCQSADIDLAKENERLRKENRLLLEEREVLKKATVFFAKSKQVKFAFVEEHRNHIPIERLCYILGITSRGYRLWRISSS